ncbi:MAG: hypothetical protein CL746_02945 [Chloroflexi bacterium]|nr:hypothetical protein [Chloroflexota bacterium]
MSIETLEIWALEGLNICKISPRSWEVAIDYFNSSTDVQRHLPSAQFIAWTKIGTRLSKLSIDVAKSYFLSSPKAMLRIRPRHLDDWVNLSSKLYKGTWKSAKLSSKFFEITPFIMEYISFEEWAKYADFLNNLSKRSYDLAIDSLDLSISLFEKLDNDSGEAINLLLDSSEKCWKDIKIIFEAINAYMVEIEPFNRNQILNLSRKLLVTGNINPIDTMKKTSSILSKINNEEKDQFFNMAKSLSSIDPKSSNDFFDVIPLLLEKINFQQITSWHSQGIKNSENQNSELINDFFTLKSKESREIIDSLSSSIELSNVKDIIRNYSLALTGRQIEVKESSQLAEKNIGWFGDELATTEGSTIFMPSIVNRYLSKEQNFGFLKVISTHQIGHIEFGSFDFDFKKSSNFFEDLRVNETLNNKILGNDYLTDLSKFFDIFSDKKLSLDIFTIFESTRVDSHIFSEYLGIINTYTDIRDSALINRPKIIDLPVRESLVEFLVRISLGQKTNLHIPTEYSKEAKKLSRLIKIIASNKASVEDSAEATIRAYHILIDIKNEQKDEDEFEEFDNDESNDEIQDDNYQEEEIINNLFSEFYKSNDHNDESSDNPENLESDESDDEYSSPQDIDYRGEFKPELSQLLSQMEYSENEFDDLGTNEPITQEQLEEMLKNSPEMEEFDQNMEESDNSKLSDVIENLMKELSNRDIENNQNDSGTLQHVDEDGGPLSATEDGSFTYDEWDFRASEYKINWCMIQEKVMADGDSEFYKKTLNDNSHLLFQIKKQFELFIPEMYRKQKRLIDGEEHDLDAVLEAVIDLKTGITPDEKLYWRRNKHERSVAVAFLLDMSASTAEAIDDTKKSSDEWGAPDDPVEYMAWLRSRRTDGIRRSYKRIVDVEKEGISLLVNSLETLGDMYGIYGFSGYGRENVEFYTIKDLDEKFSEIIPKRIDRISPLHATRMGPAIRHTITKLSEADTKSKFLFLISDGRPQDRGYSREGVEKEYAVHDTKQSLIEAKNKGITPFCLTVDKSGHDYMKTMMDDFSYEVLTDISMLPKRLPQLYKNLTT